MSDSDAELDGPVGGPFVGDEDAVEPRVVVRNLFVYYQAALRDAFVRLHRAPPLVDGDALVALRVHIRGLHLGLRMLAPAMRNARALGPD